MKAEGGVVVEEELPDDGRPADAELGGGGSLRGTEIAAITRVFISREDKGGALESSNEEFDVLGSPVVEAGGESCDKVGKVGDVVG